MSEDAKFKKLVAEGRPTGEVVGVDRFLIQVKGLDQVTVGAKIHFNNNDQGLVRQVDDDHVTVLNLSSEQMPLGVLAVLDSGQLETPVGDSLLGRVLSPLMEPLDGGSKVSGATKRQVFMEAPSIAARSALEQQLVSGVMVVDTLFPLVLGQRMAVLGDSKAGKTTFLSQLVDAQKGLDRLIVIALIGKRPADIDTLVTRLSGSGILEQCVIIAADNSAALPQAYLAPYVACAIAEHFWFAGRDTIVIYDDLTSHAKVYRELSLLAGGSPGRDSYPGDLFYAHSSLLERAGRLADPGSTLSALPVVLTPNDDITAYLPTNIMSITDGQLIFDRETFRKGIRPAVNVGLSVSRVGSKVQPPGFRNMSKTVFKKLADYRQAEIFSHFGSEIALQTQADLELGKLIYEAFKQTPQSSYTLVQQRLILETLLRSMGKDEINMELLRQSVMQFRDAEMGEPEIEVEVTKLAATCSLSVAGSGVVEQKT